MEPPIRTLIARVLAQQESMLSEFLAEATTHVDSPEVGSPARQDLDLIGEVGEESGIEGLRAWTHRACALNIVAAHEHAKGLALVVASAELLPMPGLALARSIFESVIQTCWLLDSEVSSEQRLARWAGRLLHDSQETPNVLSMVPETVVAETEATDAVEGRALGQRLMARAGFTLRAKGGDRSSETANVTFRGATSGLLPKVDALFRRFAPGEAHLWPILSGATHSRGWLVAGLEGDEATMLTSVVAPVLDASDALVVEVGRYLGVPVRTALERTHFHRNAVLKRARPSDGPVAGLDAYRASVGAWVVPPK